MNYLSTYRALVKREFADYSLTVFQRDFFSALTVAAVALPLALAFGVAAGVGASAGLVASILAGILIGTLGGSSLQISGPTGGMSAVLIVYAIRLGPDSLWLIGFLAGFFLLLIGFLRLSRFILLPSPVITGFSSGIAIIIAFGQVDNMLGIKTPAAESIIERLVHYLTQPLSPNGWSIGVTVLVMVIMAFWPRGSLVPGSLLGIVVATIVVYVAGLDVPLIGDIPRSIMLAERLRLGEISMGNFGRILIPSLTVAALATIQTLLISSVITNMTGKRPNNDVELVGQGISNMIIPFFGGLPGTGAIARTSVNIKSGGTTRMVPILHGVTLLLVVFVFAPIIEGVPLSSLAGVLMMTAWRMNDWTRIRLYFKAPVKHAIATFLVTLFAIVLLDLTQAIVIGTMLSLVLFGLRLRRVGKDGVAGDSAETPHNHFHPTGPLYFANVQKLRTRIEKETAPSDNLILNLQQVSALDISALETLQAIQTRQHNGGGSLTIQRLQPDVEKLMVQIELIDRESSS